MTQQSFRNRWNFMKNTLYTPHRRMNLAGDICIVIYSALP